MKLIRCDKRVGFRKQPTKYLHNTVGLGTPYNMWGGNVFYSATLSIQNLRFLEKYLFKKNSYTGNCYEMSLQVKDQDVFTNTKIKRLLE